MKGKRIRVWAENGEIRFRMHRKHRVFVLSLQDCWDMATNQLPLFR